jgi:hypothetical protein
VKSAGGSGALSAPDRKVCAMRAYLSMWWPACPAATPTRA